jgi:hypothetical protein
VQSTKGNAIIHLWQRLCHNLWNSSILKWSHVNIKFEAAKEDTWADIESISAVSEETAAVILQSFNLSLSPQYSVLSQFSIFLEIVLNCKSKCNPSDFRLSYNS